MRSLQSAIVVQGDDSSLRGGNLLWEDFSRRQREEIREEVSRVRDQGASGDETCVAIAEFLIRSKHGLRTMLNPKSLYKSYDD